MKAAWKAVITLVLCVSLAGLAHSFETDFDDIERFDRSLPAWKFGRGIVNILAGPRELCTHMSNNAIKGAYFGAYDGSLQGYIAGATNGYIAGFFPGLYYGLRRMTVGALEVVTFWKPEYGPTLDPHYGTRGDAMGYQDYFDPDPYWYNGPDR